MIKLIFLVLVIVNVAAIFKFRNYSDSNEKTAFYSGIAAVVCLPFASFGLLLGATNIQGVHGDLGGYAFIVVILFFATCNSAYALAKRYFKNIIASNRD